MKKLMLALVLAPAFAGAAPAGKIKTLQPINNAKLDGLSGYVTFDLADSMDYTRSVGNESQDGSYGGEKAFGLGAKYLLKTFESGIGVEVGGSYEFGRTLSNQKENGTTQTLQQKPEIQFWTMYGNGVAFLTQELGVYGGMNYNIPQVKNVRGGDFKGKVGYQLGATYLVSSNIAVDGEYRTLNLSGSAKDANDQTNNFDNIRSQGFLMRGRYMF